MTALVWFCPGNRIAGRLHAGLAAVPFVVCLVIAGLRPLAAVAEDQPPAAAGDRANNEPQARDPVQALRIPVSPLFVYETRPSWERPLPFAPDFSEAERQALWEFRKTYVLEPGEVVKRVASPPFLGRTLDRVVFTMRNGGDWKGAKSDRENDERLGNLSNQIYRWRYGEPVWVSGILAAGAHNRGTNFADLIGLISGLPPLAIDGDAALRKTSVSGDFIIREGEPLETLLPRLGEVIRRECKLPVKLTFRDVGRRVLVVRGRFQPRSLTDQALKPVVIAPAIPKNLKPYYSDEGDFDHFLNKLGRQLGWLVVADDVQADPKTMRWLYAIDHIPAKDTGRVLQLVSEQTGLSFSETTRRVRLLFVERAE